MLHNRPPGRLLVLTGPKLIQLPEFVQRHASTRQVFGQLDQAVNVPRQQPASRCSEVVLFPHLPIVSDLMPPNERLEPAALPCCGAVGLNSESERRGSTAER